MFPMRLPLIAALCLPLSAIAAPPLAYTQAMTTIDRLYLYPDQIDANTLLLSAAEGLSEEIDWLMVHSEADMVMLSHGDGTPLGSVTVGSIDTLPHAMANLEELVTDSGYDIGDADVRLAVLDGLTGALDRYSRVLSGDRLSRFEVRLKGTLVGVGISYRVQPEGARVRSLVSDGPAERAGVQVDDIIVAVDGVPTRNMESSDISRRIRGEEGTSVILGLQRADEMLSVSIQRAELPVPNVHEKVLEDRVGYVRIDHFSQRTVEHLRAAMDRLREEQALTHGLVIDLRGNTGGSMKEAARSADQFLTEGLLLRTAGRDGNRVQNLQGEMVAVDAGDEPEIPVVVLMDRQTASGSEILAGALLAHHRVGLVGTRSYGKGTVQKIYTLRDGLRLKLTVARYLLDGDVSVADTGIVPDVAVGEVILGEYGARYRRWREEDSGHPWDDVIPAVEERSGWRGQESDDIDVPLELARRAILRSYSWEREPVVAALRQVAGELRVEEDAQLVEAFAARDIDWSHAPEAMPVPEAAVQVAAEPGPDPDSYIVSATIRNDGEQPLHRALVELECDSFRYWNGLVIPVGLVPPGESITQSVRVDIRPGYHRREDGVSVTLRSDLRPVLQAESTVLAASSRQDPHLAAQIRLDGIGDERQARVTVRNLSDVVVEGLELSFAAPGSADIELLDSSKEIERLAPGEHGEVVLGLGLSGDSPAELPLQLRLNADIYRSLGTWSFELPVGGDVVSLEPPTLAILSDVAAPAGGHTLQVRAEDSVGIDHVVLFADDRKIGWAPGSSEGVDLSVDVSLEPGVNTFTAIAEDSDGLRSSRRFTVRGHDIATADASP